MQAGPDEADQRHLSLPSLPTSTAHCHAAGSMGAGEVHISTFGIISGCPPLHPGQRLCDAHSPMLWVPLTLKGTKPSELRSAQFLEIHEDPHVCRPRHWPRQWWPQPLWRANSGGPGQLTAPSQQPRRRHVLTHCVGPVQLTAPSQPRGGHVLTSTLQTQRLRHRWGGRGMDVHRRTHGRAEHLARAPRPTHRPTPTC